MPLSNMRATPSRDGFCNSFAIASGETIYRGALVMLNANGEAQAGATATSKTAAGRAETSTKENASVITVRRGTFRWNNSASGDLITAADWGKTVYIVDDSTVAKTNGTNTRSAAGIWRRVGEFFEGLWNGIRSGFEAIWGPIIAAIERVERFFNREGQGATTAPAAQAQRRANFGGRGAAGGFYGPEAAVPNASRAPWAGEITVRAAPGTEVVQATTPDRNVRMSTPDRGMSRGRP